MDKEVIYTDSTSAADGRDGFAVAAHSALAPASVHPPNVELAIMPPVEPLPPGNALLKLSAPEQDGGERGAFPLHSAPARVRKTRSAGAPFIPPYVAEQRRSILHLLIRMGELAPNITLDDKGLVTLALKSLSFIQRSPTNKTLLFQELEKANYWYGGQGHHVTLVSQQDTAIRLWLTQLLFGGTLEHWIVHTLIPQCDESELTLSKLRGKMYDQLLNLVECDASYTRDEANQLWQFLMLAHCPLLI